MAIRPELIELGRRHVLKEQIEGLGPVDLSAAGLLMRDALLLLLKEEKPLPDAIKQLVARVELYRSIAKEHAGVALTPDEDDPQYWLGRVAAYQTVLDEIELVR